MTGRLRWAAIAAAVVLLLMCRMMDAREPNADLQVLQVPGRSYVGLDLLLERCPIVVHGNGEGGRTWTETILFPVIARARPAAPGGVDGIQCRAPWTCLWASSAEEKAVVTVIHPAHATSVAVVLSLPTTVLMLPRGLKYSASTPSIRVQERHSVTSFFAGLFET